MMKHIQTIYGDEILKDELKKIANYVLITNPVPWQLHQSYFLDNPVKVIMPDTLDRAELDNMITDIPNRVEFIGLGGGAVLDATKYFALIREKEPILIPTITSTDAPFSDFISVTNEKGFRTGFKKVGWTKHIIVDYALIRKADPRFNRAGYGDLLCMISTLDDWRMASKAGKGVPLDPAMEETILSIMERAIDSASIIGSMNSEGIEILMKLTEKKTELIMSNLDKPISAGSEHLFAWNLDVTTGRHFIHGEIVALGILISSYLHNKHFHDLKHALDEAQVRYQPERLDISWDEIINTLLSIEEYNRNIRQFHTIFEEIEWTPGRLNEIKEVVFGWGNH